MSQSVHSNRAVERGEPPTETYEARLMRDDARRIAADMANGRLEIVGQLDRSADGCFHTYEPTNNGRVRELLEAFAASLDERLKRPDLGHFEPTVAVYCAECSREIDGEDDESDQ